MKLRHAARLLHRPNAAVGGLILLIVLIAAGLGTIYTPHDPIIMNFDARLLPPSGAHWLGTDEWGRDVLSRLLSGASITIRISLLVVLATILSGACIGTLVGFIGGWVGRCIMVPMDALQSFPSLIMALGVITMIGPSRYGVVIALSLAYLPIVVRVVRGNVLSIREKEFIEASLVMGNRDLFTMARHVLPNAISPIIVLATALFGWAVLSESALSFLGLGIPPPASSWGGMLADSRNYFSEAPWLAIAPGISVSLTLLGINLFGDALRDEFDPRMRSA